MHWIALRLSPESDASPSALADPTQAWAWWALRFTPSVARVEDALLLEISGSQRLFGGLEALMAQFKGEKSPLAQVEYAQGATSLVALGRLWSGLPDAPASDLPLHTLQCARPHLAILARLGCKSWGHLRGLPRGGVVRRFGQDLLSALDRAFGQAPELYPWLGLPEVFDMPLELAASVESAPGLLFGARRLLAQLLVWLRARQRGVLALELLWELDARRSNLQHTDAHHDGGNLGRLELRTAQATQDMAHLQRLLGEQLSKVTLPAPVLHLRLRTLQTQKLGGETLSLLPEDVRLGDSLHQLLERLCARLGREQVLGVELQADHRPECMQRWLPWGVEAPQRSDALVPVASSLQPPWLLEVPQRLEVKTGRVIYQGELDLQTGPHRLEVGWLDGEPALRDYFLAHSPLAGLVWIYRERPEHGLQEKDQRWYLHGVFG